MTSLEKKQQSVEKMAGKLSTFDTNPAAKKPSDCINLVNVIVQFLRNHHVLTKTEKCAQLRFCEDVEHVHSKMEISYAKFAEFLTEMKMDHDCGKLPSDALNTLLVYILI